MSPRNPAPTYQGNPCRAGHSGERYQANGACVQCALDRRASTYDKALEAAYKRDYRARQRMAAATLAPALPVDVASQFADLL